MQFITGTSSHMMGDVDGVLVDKPTRPATAAVGAACAAAGHFILLPCGVAVHRCFGMQTCRQQLMRCWHAHPPTVQPLL
jgi:hypothetical protein